MDFCFHSPALISDVPICNLFKSHACRCSFLGPPTDEITSDNVPSAPWILELLTTPSARLDPIIKVSSKETN